MKTFLILATTIFFVACNQSDAVIQKPSQNVLDVAINTDNLQLATFAGGCFWCMEKPFESLSGTVNVTSGFSGGEVKNPAYTDVTAGQTGHKESVQLAYDPAIVTYEELLNIFWRQINPTDEGGQFADRGMHYTTAIFYHTPKQKVAAERSKAALNASGKFTTPIVTSILPYSAFYKAEDYHQDYYKKNEFRYSLYYKGSGRAGFLAENWKNDTIVY